MILTFECSLIGISHCPVWFTCFQSKTFQNPIFQPFFVGWWKNTPPQEAERTLDHHPTPALMLDNSMTLWISMFCGSHPHACWNFETNSAEHISISISIFSLAMSPCYLQPPSCVEIKNTLMASLGGPARNESSLIFSILRCLVLNPYTIPILKNVLRPFHRRFQRFRGTSARPAPQEAVRRPRLPQRTVATGCCRATGPGRRLPKSRPTWAADDWNKMWKNGTSTGKTWTNGGDRNDWKCCDLKVP